MNAMKLTWQLDTTAENAVVSLVGVLNRYTLLPLWQQRQHFVLTNNIECRHCQNIIWDLNAIGHIDSAGFALLTELLRLNSAERVKLINVPIQCLNLAALFSLKDWLAKYMNK